MTTPNNSEPHSESKFQFPSSARIYVEGSSPDIRVPMREVHLNVTREADWRGGGGPGGPGEGEGKRESG